MKELNLEISAPDGASIPAILLEPGRIDYVCLFLHGITSDRDDHGFQKAAAEFLAARYVASLRIDFRGHGRSTEPQIEFRPSNQIVDAKAACEWLLARYPEHTLTLIGTSFGAPAALFCSLEVPQVKRLILFTPVLDYQRTFLQAEMPRMAERFSPEAMKKAIVTGFLPYGDKQFQVGIKLIEEIRHLNPRAALRQTAADVTIIHGDRDASVSFAISAGIAASDPRIRFHVFDNMGHGSNDISEPNGGPISDENEERIFDIYADAIKR